MVLLVGLAGHELMPRHDVPSPFLCQRSERYSYNYTPLSNRLLARVLLQRCRRRELEYLDL